MACATNRIRNRSIKRKNLSPPSFGFIEDCKKITKDSSTTESFIMVKNLFADLGSTKTFLMLVVSGGSSYKEILG